MIPADRSRFFSAWLARDAESRVNGAFGRVLVRGVSTAAKALAESPLLVVSNHTSYWDPLVAQLIGVRVLHAEAYALMDAANLRKLPFFRKVGAFGVDLGDPHDGARAIRYAVKRLTAPGKLLWVFPQGREVAAVEDPLVFQGGSAEIARLAKRARTLPVAIRYVFAGERLPRLYVSLGAPLEHDTSVEAMRVAQTAAVNAELGRIHDALLSPSGHEGFHVRSSRGEGPVFRAAQAMLAWLTRPRDLPA